MNWSGACGGVVVSAEVRMLGWSSYVGGGSHLYSTQQMLASIISPVAVSLVSLDPHVMMM